MNTPRVIRSLLASHTHVSAGTPHGSGVSGMAKAASRRFGIATLLHGLGLGIDVRQSAQISESILTEKRSSGGEDNGRHELGGEPKGLPEPADWAQLLAMYRVKCCQELRKTYRVRPFELPAGGTVGNLHVMQPHTPSYTPPRTPPEGWKAAAAMLTPMASPAIAHQALTQMSTPMPPPAALTGLTPGAPAALPGHAAIHSVIQTKGPISASGDFGNPNAGQGVPLQPGSKSATMRRLRRLLGV